MTEEQFLKHMARLAVKIMPEAQYFAKNLSGMWYAYNRKPVLYENDYGMYEWVYEDSISEEQDMCMFLCTDHNFFFYASPESLSFRVNDYLKVIREKGALSSMITAQLDGATHVGQNYDGSLHVFYGEPTCADGEWVSDEDSIPLHNLEPIVDEFYALFTIDEILNDSGMPSFRTDQHLESIISDLEGIGRMVQNFRDIACIKEAVDLLRRAYS